ncbi:hypothetical protein [Microlunatus parietis]|uniref:Uncharacterized protein n=1 Tax=Microlunatus parietis TaxID=682979 RepID=A0A7Y9I978_9ACTN|nr:hypothetical protein [Microlunatus parietis]NYE72094.1 hypothetical protein [Microlunatus parietis]
MTARNPLRRTSRQEPDRAPVVLPQVVITVADAGALDVTVDGQPLPPPHPGAGPWTREGFGSLLDAVTQNRMIAVRVEVHESDGSVFTDIIRARKPIPPVTAETPEPETRRSRRTHARQTPELVEVTGEGFVPGEDVAVALIVSHTDATGTGHARTFLDTAQLGQTSGVVLYGCISGTTVIRRLP